MNQAETAARFLRLHSADGPLLMPNAWDAGSAKLLATLGFQALATTSSGYAATLGKLDGTTTRDEALAGAQALVEAVDVPVSADLENGFGADPADVAETVRLAIEAGLAGCSVEDFDGDQIYPLDVATERVAAAVDAAHGGPTHFVLTARAENLIRGRADLDDTIARLKAYEEAGADVLFAPGLASVDEIRQVVDAVERPVNVLVVPGVPPVTELAELGVSRVSVGGAFMFAALGTLAAAASELRDRGTYGYGEAARNGLRAAREAFG